MAGQSLLSKKMAMSIFRKVCVVVFATLLFVVLAWIPSVGYAGKAHVYSPIKKYTLSGFAVVNYNCSVTFSPFLYPLSWVLGRGVVSGNFSMIYLPQGYTSGAFGSPIWGKPETIRREALMKVVMEEQVANLPLLPFAFFAIEFVGRRRLYLWFLGGVLGFSFWVPFGAVVGFLIALLLTTLMWQRLRRLLARSKVSRVKVDGTQ